MRNDRLAQALAEVRALRDQIPHPAPLEDWQEAEKTDPALLADRLGIPLAPVDREALRHPAAPDEPHVGFVHLTRCLWNACYGRPPANRSPTGARAELESRLRAVAERIINDGGVPSSPAALLAVLWYGEGFLDEIARQPA